MRSEFGRRMKGTRRPPVLQPAMTKVQERLLAHWPARCISTGTAAAPRQAPCSWCAKCETRVTLCPHLNCTLLMGSTSNPSSCSGSTAHCGGAAERGCASGSRRKARWPTRACSCASSPGTRLVADIARHHVRLDAEHPRQRVRAVCRRRRLLPARRHGCSSCRADRCRPECLL